MPAGDARSALAEFRPAGRRFERVGETETGAEVYDDYAHHPTEVRATLDAARTLEPGRVVAAFQPHLYSRTAALWREFGDALALADLAVVLDVYRAREDAADFPGVSGLLVAEAAADAGEGRQVAWMPGFDEAERFLRGAAAAGRSPPHAGRRGRRPARASAGRLGAENGGHRGGRDRGQ